VLPYAYVLASAIPLIGSVLVPLIAFVSEKARDVFAVVCGFVAAAFALSMVPDVIAGKTGVYWHLWIPYVNIRVGFYVDPLSVFMACIATGIGALVLLYSLGYMEGDPGLTRYYSLMLLFIGGMVGLVTAASLVQLYLFWEVVGICSFALIGFWYEKPEAARAGVKAFLTTRFGDCLLLAGILMLYSNTGTFEIPTLLKMGHNLPVGVLTTVAVLFMWGAIGKSAQVPLHVWLPDAMEGPTTVSALIHAATMVKAGIYLVARMFPMFSLSPTAMTFLAWIAAITAFMSAFCALASDDIKRVLAYSTISQLAYMLGALSIATPAGFFASNFHLMSHAVFKALLFLGAGSVIHALGTRNIDEMGGLWDKMKITGITFLIGTCAISGIPPFNGFWSKDLIVHATKEAGNYALMTIWLLTALLTTIYSFRLFFRVFTGKPTKKAEHAHEAPPVMTVPLCILAAACFVTGFLEHPFLEFFEKGGYELTVHGGVDLTALTLSLAVLALGLYISYMVFYRREPGPDYLVNRYSIIRAMQKAAFVGFGFDYLYGAIVEGFKKTCNSLFTYFELGGVEGFNRLLSRAVIGFARRVRVLQTGVLNYNIVGIILGFLVFVFLIIYYLV